LLRPMFAASAPLGKFLAFTRAEPLECRSKSHGASL
jgi:hypothetical protein